MATRWSDLLTDQERSKLAEFKRRQRVKDEAGFDRLLAEFGRYYGWPGIEAVLSGKVSARLFLSLIRNGRRMESERQAIALSDVWSAIAVRNDKHGGNKISKRVRERCHV